MRLRHAVVGSAFVSALIISSCGGTGDNANPTAPTRSVDPVSLYRAYSADVGTYWQNYLGSRYRPVARFQLFFGQTGGACGTVYDPRYCPLDDTVYLERNFMDRKLQQFGNFAPAVIIAHEIGHHIQTILGVDKTFTISMELQADCLAGAWAANAKARGVLEAGDIQEGAATMFSVGDAPGTPWFAEGAHGTAFKRIDAFNRGYRNGPDGCNL